MHHFTFISIKITINFNSTPTPGDNNACLSVFQPITLSGVTHSVSNGYGNGPRQLRSIGYVLTIWNALLSASVKILYQYGSIAIVGWCNVMVFDCGVEGNQMKSIDDYFTRISPIPVENL